MKPAWRIALLALLALPLLGARAGAQVLCGVEAAEADAERNECRCRSHTKRQEDRAEGIHFTANPAFAKASFAELPLRKDK